MSTTLLLTLQLLVAKGFSFSPSPAHPSRTHSSSSLELARRRSDSRREEQPSNLADYRDDVLNEEGDEFAQQERRPGSIDYARVPAIESTNLYFSSPSVQKHVARSRQTYDDDDDFYQIKVPSATTQWRTQANLVVYPASTWSRAEGCAIGVYQRRSRYYAPSAPDSEVYHPSINRAVDVIAAATRTVRTPGYTEETGEGLLRYLSCQVESSSGKVCLSLVMNAEKFKECQPQLSYLVKELKRNGNAQLWHSIWVHCNDSKGTAMFAQDASRWHPLDGPPYVREQIPGSDPEEREGLLYFSPQVFRHANLEGFGAVAKEVREAIPSGSKVCQLNAGVGLLGLSALLYHGKQANVQRGGLTWLRCSDESRENARCFDRAVNSMPTHITGLTPRKFQKNGAISGRRGRNASRQGGNKGRSGGGEVSIKHLMDSMMSDAGSGRSGGNNRNNSSQNDPSERVTFMQANAATALFKGQILGADVLIVDPPRKGLDKMVLQHLCLSPHSKQPYAEKANMLSHLPRHTINWTNDVRTLIYVTMFGDTLAQDLDSLFTSQGGWKLDTATGHVLFPGSNHVETVVVLRR